MSIINKDDEPAIKTKLKELSGLTNQELSMGIDNPGLQDIMDVMMEIHKGKAFLYGDYIKTHGNDTELFCLMRNYCDIYRKYLRAEHFMKESCAGKAKLDTDMLMETYADMALYSLLGIQLIAHLNSKQV